MKAKEARSHDFIQQRVAGYFMVYMLFELKSLLPIGLDGDYDLLEISFETANSIDDIEVSTDSCKIFIQAKRSISLSSSENSEFAKVIRWARYSWRF